MTEDRESRVREHAYRLWEQEGRPEGRQEAHWHAAERAVPHHAASDSAAEVEGSHTATRRDDEAAHRFAPSDKVTEAARDAAAALSGVETPPLRAGEAAGKSRARGEDPAAKRRAS